MGRLGCVCVVDTLRVLKDDGVWRMQPEDLGAPRKPSNFKQEGELSTCEGSRLAGRGARREVENEALLFCSLSSVDAPPIIPPSLDRSGG